MINPANEGFLRQLLGDMDSVPAPGRVDPDQEAMLVYMLQRHQTAAQPQPPVQPQKEAKVTVGPVEIQEPPKVVVGMPVFQSPVREVPGLKIKVGARDGSRRAK